MKNHPIVKSAVFTAFVIFGLLALFGSTGRAATASPTGLEARAAAIPPAGPPTAVVDSLKKELDDTRALLTEAQTRAISADQVIATMQEQRNQLAQQMLDTQVQLRLAQKAVEELQKKLTAAKEPAAKPLEISTEGKK